MRVQVPPSAQNIFVTRTDLMNKLLLLLFTTLTFSNSYNDALIAFESKEYKTALDAINEIIQNDKGNHKTFYLLVAGIIGLFILVLAVALGASVLGELGEKSLTLVGSIMVVCAHFKNHQICKELACSCHDESLIN